jgi:hypothetical protein
LLRLVSTSGDTPQPIESRPRISKSDLQVAYETPRTCGVTLAPDLLEPHRQVQDFIRTNRAGNALQGVRGALQAERITVLGCVAQRDQALVRLLEETADDPRDGVRLVGPLQLTQGE